MCEGEKTSVNKKLEHTHMHTYLTTNACLKASGGFMAVVYSIAEYEDLSVWDLNRGALGWPARLIVSHIPLLSRVDLPCTPPSSPLPGQTHCVGARDRGCMQGTRLKPLWGRRRG